MGAARHVEDQSRVVTRIVASIEARMGASRLPGKVLMDIAGLPALSRMLARVRQSHRIDDIVIATSTAAPDDAIAAWADGEGLAVYRGSEDNVLERVLEAHRSMRSDLVVKLCGDCPVIDPDVIDLAIARFERGDVDFVTTTMPQSYPEGLDVEVFERAALEDVAARCDDAHVREHVCSDFYRAPERWRLASLEAPPALRRPELRLLLDYPSDRDVLIRLYQRLDDLHGDRFTTAQLIALIDREHATLAPTRTPPADVLPLRTVIVGFGKIADTMRRDRRMARYFPDASHAQILKRHPAFDWLAVVDPSAEARARARTDWGIEICAADVADLPDPGQFTAAVIASPPGQRPHVLNGLPSLRAVLVEKPLGSSAAEAAAFVDACERRGIKVQVNYWRRGDDSLSALGSRTIPEHLGEIQAVFGLYGNGLRNNGSHLIDLVRMAAGEVIWVEALTGPQPGGGPIPGDIHVPLALGLASGAVACLQPVAFSHYREVGLDVWGTKGRLQIVQEGLVTLLSPREANRGLEDAEEIASDAPCVLPCTVAGAFSRIYDNLARAVAGSEPLVSSGRSALVTERIVDAAIASALGDGRRLTIST